MFYYYVRDWKVGRVVRSRGVVCETDGNGKFSFFVVRVQNDVCNEKKKLHLYYALGIIILQVIHRRRGYCKRIEKPICFQRYGYRGIRTT